MRDILLLIRLEYGNKEKIMKKHIQWIAFFLFLITVVAYIRLNCEYKQFQALHMNYVGDSATKHELLKIYNFLETGNYLDQFGYLRREFRFNHEKKTEILSKIYEEKLFLNSGTENSVKEKFSHQEYHNCLRTLLVLSYLIESYGILKTPEEGVAEKIQFMQCKMTFWVLNFPHGEFIGNEAILKDRCSKNLKKFNFPQKNDVTNIKDN